jgi:2-dehydro-3-deoxygalactonokinase
MPMLDDDLLATPACLGIDWGSTSLRAALLDADGRVLAERSAPCGLLQLPAGGWADAFERQVGDWRARWPALRTLMAGMVGSRHGWSEAPYCGVPAGAGELAAALHWLEPGRLGIVPGVDCDDAGVPDVMRGEETQVIGAMALLQRRDATLVLPGTHSKWVRVEHGRIRHFATAMSGEAYALWRRQSMLARSLPAGEDGPIDDAAFDAGVERAQRDGGLLHHLFGVRTLALFEHRPAASLASYLSGLVIGDELRALAPPVAGAGELVVIGAPGLAARYARALRRQGHATRQLGDEACWRGLVELGRRIDAR